MRMVLESAPGRCDLFHDKRFCCRLINEREEFFHIEAHVREAIASFLAGCGATRPCLAIDLGANVGWMSAYMLGLGAHVVSVEPQADLAAALNETVALNCWGARSKVLAGFACSPGASSCVRGRKVPYQPYRSGAGVPPTTRLPAVPGFGLDDIFFGAVGDYADPRGTSASSSSSPSSHASSPVGAESGGSSQRRHIDFLKLDGDGPELEWMATIEQMLSSSKAAGKPTLTIDAITVEHMPAHPQFNNFPGRPALTPGLLARFQQVHGYDIYRLDTDDARRLVSSEGWDLYSPNGTYARLDHVRGKLARDGLETELLMVRSMRRVFRAHRGLSRAQWETWARSVGDPHIRWHVMEILLVHRRVKLLEPRAIGDRNAPVIGMRNLAKLARSSPEALASHFDERLGDAASTVR